MRPPAAPRASLMAKIRATVSNFTCKGSLVEFTTKNFFLAFKRAKKERYESNRMIHAFFVSIF